jgi:hypothetical protein
MSQSLAFLRVTQVNGKDTSDDQDPYLTAGFYSQGRIGTSGYANEPIHFLAPPYNYYYPGMRWAALHGSKTPISIALFTEQYNLFATGRIADLKLTGGGGVSIYHMTMNVDRSSSLAGGMTWRLLSSEKPDDSLTFEDFTKLRGRKIARKGAAKIWEYLTD